MAPTRLPVSAPVEGRQTASTNARVAALDWLAAERALDEQGYALVGPLLDDEQCRWLVTAYEQRERFRKRVDMARLRFGVGEYKYFARPLPALVEDLRAALYDRLAPVANRWMERLRIAERFPAQLAGLAQLCGAHGQSAPTPLMLRYEAGGYNCMHQDLYGEVAFPLQATVMLSRPEHDFSGGEFLLLEQRPRAQSRAEAVRLAHGEAIIFATRWRPIKGASRYHRAAVRHGVSVVRSGTRYTLGIIFHDARS